MKSTAYRPPRILMVNLPFSGHTNPTLGLAQALVAQGCDVTYVHDPRWQPKIEFTGARFVPYQRYKSSWNPIKKILSSWEAAYTTLVMLEEDYDCLVYEMLFLPGERVAKMRGMPAVRLFSTFALNRTVIDIFIRTGGRIIKAILGFRPLTGLLSRIIRKKFHLERHSFIEEITDCPLPVNYVYTVRDFQLNNQDFPEGRFRFIGPSMMPRADVAPIDFTTITKPIIYISLGTLVNLTPSFYKKCIKAFQGEDVTVIMSLGSVVSRESLGNIPDNFMVFPSVPQLEVLRHAALFITHGGMNSVNEALYYGVPLLVVPFFFDQPAIAARVEELHLGRKLDRRRLKPNHLRSSALSVIADSSLKRNLGNMKEQMAHAGGNNRAAREIIDFLQK